MINSILKSLLIFLFYLGVAHTVWICFYVDENGLNGDQRYNMEKMLQGRADRPFAYRVLMPLTVNTITHFVGDRFFTFYEKYYWNEKIDKELQLAQLNSNLKKEWIVFTWLSILSFAIFGLTLSVLIQKFYLMDSPTAHAWSLTSLALLPLILGPSYMNDPLSLFLPTVLFLVLLNQNIVVYYFIFLLSVINKETSILYYSFFFSFYKQSKSVFFLLLNFAAHLVIYLLIIQFIHFEFMNNPGNSIEFQLVNNLNFLLSPSYKWLTMLLKIGVISLLVLYQLSEKPKILVNSFCFVLIPLVPLYLVFGRLIEIRVFLDFYFLICLLSLPSTLKLFNLKNR